MEPGHPYCGKCGYNERFGPPPDASLAKPPVAASYGYGAGRGGSETPNGDLTAAARDALRGNWGIAIGTMFLYFIIVSVIGAVPLLGTVAMVVVSGPFSLGMATFFLNLSRGTSREVELIFRGFSQLGVAFAAYWLMFIFVFLWALLLVVPGIIKAFSYSMTYMIIADNEGISAMDAIRKSQEMMNGNKAKLFSLFCRFIGWGILCLFTLGIGFLWLMPYMAVSVAKFYDDIKDH